jgi:hypothetical protein
VNLETVAAQINNTDKKIILVYAFNATGKTRLSVAFKDVTKTLGNGEHTGIYYNAFSEDLFIWDNDTENDELDIRLTVKSSSLNKYHNLLTEEAIREKLRPYKPKYDFRFQIYGDVEKGIESVSFYIKDDEDTSIKISRGEERIFVWCFFLALFEVEELADKQNKHFFIDDPVSSLDDHNIFITATTIYDLIDRHYKDRKIIITTHHIGFFSILADWLRKGEKSSRYEKITELYILSKKDNELSLESCNKDVFLYHLHLLQTLDKANNEQLYTFHFALLRQVLENVASFLGAGQFGYVLDQIGIEDVGEVAMIVNALAHQKVYHYQTEVMNPDNEALFKNVFEKLKDKYQFKLHTN